MSKRLAITLASVIAALMVACTVIVVITFSNATAATREADYRACVTAGGVYDTDSTEGMAAIAEQCYSSVYGE